MAECRCMCSPCGHDDHCGGEVCPYQRDLDGVCGWCERLKDVCNGDPCVDAVEFLAESYGERPSGAQDEQIPLPAGDGTPETAESRTATVSHPTDKNGESR